MTSCEVCGAPTVYNIICVEIARQLANGTVDRVNHPKHMICRPCEAALIERNSRPGSDRLYLQRFAACPHFFTDEDRTMLVLGR